MANGGASSIERYLSAKFRGNSGHACEPAGRGTTEPTWTCPACAAVWRVVEASTSGVTTRTWERA